jgi:hypothetical protein
LLPGQASGRLADGDCLDDPDAAPLVPVRGADDLEALRIEAAVELTREAALYEGAGPFGVEPTT